MARKEKDLGPPRIRSLRKPFLLGLIKRDTPISGPVIQAQAKKLNEDLRGEGSDFGATTGWLKGFKGRHGIFHVTIQASSDRQT